MEALAAVSSVAGLLSLAGQCVSGAQNLLSLYRDFYAASNTVQKFMRDVSGLLRTLEDVRVLLSKIQQQAPGIADDVCLTSLKLQLEDCDRDVGLWLRTAQSTKPTGGRGSRAWFRKFWTAMDKQSTNNLRADIQKRRTEIVVALSILGRSIDLRIGLIAEDVNHHVRETHATTHALVSSSTDANETLSRLETISLSMSDEIGSMRSLLSSCDSLSSGEAERVPSPMTVWTQGWQCDKWHALDSLFGPIERLQDDIQIRPCTFCGLKFLEPPSVDIREHHMRVTHRLSACVNNTALYLDQTLFHHHLIETHNASIGPWTPTLESVCCVHNEAGEVTKKLGCITEDELKAEYVDDAPEPAVDPWEEVSPRSAGEALVASLWDSSLLGEWTSKRDRINRWMLHMLGAEAGNTDTLYAAYQRDHSRSLDISGKAWSRFLLKYWFIDEAALGPKQEAATANSIPGELGVDNSSLHLSARPSGTKSVPSLRMSSWKLALRSLPPLLPSSRARGGSTVGSLGSSMGSIESRLFDRSGNGAEAMSNEHVNLTWQDSVGQNFFTELLHLGDTPTHAELYWPNWEAEWEADSEEDSEDNSEGESDEP